MQLFYHCSWPCGWPSIGVQAIGTSSPSRPGSRHHFYARCIKRLPELKQAGCHAKCAVLAEATVFTKSCHPTLIEHNGALKIAPLGHFFHPCKSSRADFWHSDTLWILKKWFSPGGILYRSIWYILFTIYSANCVFCYSSTRKTSKWEQKVWNNKL